MTTVCRYQIPYMERVWGRAWERFRNRRVRGVRADRERPEIHYMTSPLRAAAVRAADPHGTNVWAVTGFQKANAASVADIMSALA